jgi:hypothetical protein
MGSWYYKEQEFTTEIAQAEIDCGAVGFVYCITDTLNGKKYIGKKTLVSKRRLAPLKGKTKKRTKIVHSDWQKYYGSSEIVKALVAERPNDFQREVLTICHSKGALNYEEARLQFQLEVLLSDDYYNNFIGAKIHSNHVKSLWKKGS